MAKSIFKDVPATVPTVKPAVEEKTFDKWKITRLSLRPKDGIESNSDYIIIANLTKGNKLEDGSWILGTENQTIRIESLVDLMSKDAEATTLVDSVLDMIIKIGTAQGKL